MTESPVVAVVLPVSLVITGGVVSGAATVTVYDPVGGSVAVFGTASSAVM